MDVERSAQNQALLTSMDKRADLQLRLQKTVEGLSVVAISYYAVSLVSYLLYSRRELFSNRGIFNLDYHFACGWACLSNDPANTFKNAVDANAYLHAKPPNIIETVAKIVAGANDGNPARPAPIVQPPAKTPPTPIIVAPMKYRVV